LKHRGTEMFYEHILELDERSKYVADSMDMGRMEDVVDPMMNVRPAPREAPRASPGEPVSADELEKFLAQQEG
jgi:hypothetical protein